MNAPQPAPEKRQRPAWLERLGAFVLACVVGAIRLMPLSLARGLARLAGWSFWFLGGTRLTEVDRNLRIAFGPGLEPARRKAIARAYWMHFGASVVEACHLKHWDAARARREVDVTAIETLAARWAPGRGVLLISGHLGSWEVGPYTMALLGRPIHFVHNPGTVAAVYEFLKRQRERSGMKVLARTDHPWALKKLLDRGAWLCIAGDVNAGRRGTFVPFCGVAASTYLTPAALQQTTGCPLVVATTARQPDGRHKVHVWRTFETPPPKDDPEALVRRTAEIHAGLEEAIRTYPEQWLWTYRRWRRRPEGETPDADGLPPRVNAV